MPFTDIPQPVQLALNPEVTPNGQDTTRAWRTVSEFLTKIQGWLYGLQTYVNTLGGTSPATTVQPVGPAGVVGVSPLFSPGDHAHEGVHSIGVAGTPLTGDILLGAGLSQAGNTISASGGGSSAEVPILTICPGAAAIGWPVPALTQEFNNLEIYRSQFDLTNFTEVRLFVCLPNPNAVPPLVPTITAEFSVTGGAGTFAPLDGGSGPSVVYAAGMLVSAWVTLDPAAVADVIIRIVGAGGNGIFNYPFGIVCVEAR